MSMSHAGGMSDHRLAASSSKKSRVLAASCRNCPERNVAAIAAAEAAATLEDVGAHFLTLSKAT
jgi:hypothetical protein